MPDNLYWQKDEKSIENIKKLTKKIDVRSICFELLSTLKLHISLS